MRDADVLGEAVPREQRKQLVAGAEPGHVLAGRRDPAGHVTADSTLGWCDDQTEFEFGFGFDLILNGLDSLRQTP